jgi:hypothetical protein
MPRPPPGPRAECPKIIPGAYEATQASPLQFGRSFADIALASCPPGLPPPLEHRYQFRCICLVKRRPYRFRKRPYWRHLQAVPLGPGDSVLRHNGFGESQPGGLSQSPFELGH